MTVAMGIPSNRPEQLENFFRLWRLLPGDITSVVWDGHGPACPHLDSDIEVMPWADTFKHPLIAHMDSGIRCAGFLRARKHKAPYIMTLDDDCYPDVNSDNQKK